MTTKILIERINNLYRDVEMLKIVVNASEIKPGYGKHYKMGAVNCLGEAMSALIRASQELKGLE